MEANELEGNFRKLIDPEGPIRGLPSAVETVRTILRGRPFEGLECEDGRPCDVLQALKDPCSLGVLPHIYSNSRLAAAVETVPDARNVQFLGSNLHLKLDMAVGLDEWERLRLFAADCMLTLDGKGKRILVAPDRSVR